MPARRRTPVLVAGAAVLVAAIVVAAVTLGSGSSGQTKLADVGGRPAVFQIEYRVVDTAGPAPVTRWEVVTQNGPFDVDDLHWNGPPSPGSLPASGTVSSRTGLYEIQDGRPAYVSDRQPSLGGGDLALAPELHELQERGLARGLGRARVLGETCSRVEVAAPPAGPLAPIGPAGHDVLCLDPHGLLLSERWTLNKRLVLVRTATAVRTGSADLSLTAERPLPPPAARVPTAVVRVVPHQTSVGAPISTPPAPTGFVGVPAVDAVTFTFLPGAELVPQVAGISTVWAWTRGGDVVSVEGGSGSPPWAGQDTVTRSVTLAGLGPAQTALRSDGPEIEVALSGSRWVRVRGTLELGDLVAYASSLRPAGG